ncbi:MAG: hypothetical protein ABI679_04945 [Gemmatimonadota bacterium]
MKSLLFLSLGLLAATHVAAQVQDNSCRFVLIHVGRQGYQMGTNYFAGGGVIIGCDSTRVRMSSDSLASYGGGVGIVQFIGNVKYEDTTITMTAANGTYFKAGERWEARGNVVTRNLENGSTLSGPSLDYYRALPGTRDTIEMYAIGRPRINYIPTDSTGAAEEPYLINADRVRLKGNDRVWAAGKVTIDRSDFAATADSMRLDTGAGDDATLIGTPSVRGLGSDSFNLTGRRIDLKLENRTLSYVKSLGNAHAISSDLDLVADTIGLDVNDRKLVQTLAWGDSIRPYAHSADFAIRADSLAFDTPGQRLKESRAFGTAWVGGTVDSNSVEKDCSRDYRVCDWLRGDTVVAQFVARDSAGKTRSVLQRVDAAQTARALYRTEKKGGGPKGMNYSRADRIIVTMKQSGPEGVDRVELQGKVDGVQLDPQAPATPSDSTAPKPATGRGGP